MKTTLFLALIAFGFVSCNNRNQEPNKISSQTEQADMHNSQNALDYGGVYKGLIPCADCPGIEVELTIDNSGHYTKKMTYLDREPDNVFISEGSYQWNEDGNRILLNEDAEMYLVGENKLFMLDIDGNRITGDLADMFILEQVEKIIP